MKKTKLLLAAAALMLGGSVWAQTDVTSTYITNPSFESDGIMSAGNGTTPKMIQPTGWTQEQNTPDSFQDNKICDAKTSNASNYGTLVTPSDGTYYLFYRHGWNGSNYAKFTSTAANLPSGSYSLKVDYKMVSGSDNTNNNNNTSITLSAITGEKTLGTTTAKDAVQVNNGNTAVLTNNDWITLETTFEIETETSTQFVINLLACGPKRSDFVVDNVRLLHTPFVVPTAITLNKSSLDMKITQTSELSVAAYTPDNANHKTGITWTTSDASVATVNAAGVVTAVAAGSATITATTENSVSATCSITVTDVTPVAAPANYSEIAAGDFYIVNAATGKYLGGANDWGTQASLIDHGIPFTIAESDGKYTFDSHTYNNSDDHFFNGTYVDQGSTNLYITSLGSGKYSISTADGSAFVTSNVNNTTVANTAANASSPLAQWYFVSKADRDALFASATNAAPADATYYLAEANISRNLRKAYNTRAWTGDYSYGGTNANQCAERYCNNTNVYQTVTVPNGKYTVKCQGFYRQESGSATSYLFANDEKVALNQISSGGINSMDGASEAFNNGEYWNTLTVYVTDGSLKVGIKCDAGTNWTIWDNFEIYYHGPTVAGEATEIAMDTETAMTAGNWYYFDIPVNGLYNLTTTTISDIVYTTDGTILIENEGDVDATFSTGVNENLTAGRYYVKSASAQSLEVTVGAYAYEVGSPTFSTADGGYTQSSTFTVTFPDADTTDPDGVTSFVASSTATVNGNTVDLVETTNGFTLDLGTLTANTDYAIVIPADVYGYAGQSMNSAISVTIHTPVAFDGYYFLRTTANKYVARGGDYNSRAVVDEFGLPLSVATNSLGITQFTYVDNGGKLFLNNQGNAYTDNNTAPDWTIQATDGGFYLVHADEGSYKDKKLTVWSGDNKSLFAGNDGSVFVIEPVSEHNTHMEALKDDQAAAAAKAAGNDAITSKSALETWLAASFKEVNVDVTAVSFTEKWNGDAAAEWGAGKDMYSKTITSLPEGLYKLTVNAYYRINGSATAAEGARGNTYLYGGSAKTQLYSLKDFPAAEAWSGRNQSDAAGYYPDDATSGAAATASSYLTELYVYHEGGDFTYGIHQPSRFSNGQWFGYQNFTLTRYVPAETVSVTAAGYATYASDNDLDFTGTTIKAYRATTKGDGSGVNFTEVTTVPAGEGVLLCSSKDVEFTEKIPITTGVSSWDADDNVFVRGTGAGVATDGGTTWNYILNNVSDVVGFYKAAGKTVATNRAYISISKSEAPVKEFISLPGFEDDADGIETVDNGQKTTDNSPIYNLAGQRISKMQKGINIVNGKKVLF